MEATAADRRENGTGPGPGGSDDAGDLAHRLAGAIAGRDAAALRDLLTEQIDFRAMTPGRFWEAGDRDEVVEIVFGSWFEPGDVITAVLSAGGERVADRTSVHYRLRGHNAGGDFVVEQRAYTQQTGGRIDWLRIMCSGFRPVAAS
ncbi:hypothetical protein [Microlunatus soli]|uniref:SnoaL-like domain-containing protein n=1 Tax=Microlunatus soli TaxID=630515 RepID=A0A1H1UF01_9ACTN|nr:hypothetical protein [Microlunatus soli]SDS70459.1 hypothetical protein SAMN04489812_2738 [Microlunatus soli]